MNPHAQVRDLSEFASPIGSLFPRSADDPERFRLTSEQVSFFQENGYLAGVRVLTDEQVEALRASLERLADPQHPGHSLFYEFHSNESSDPAHGSVPRLGCMADRGAVP